MRRRQFLSLAGAALVPASALADSLAGKGASAGRHGTATASLSPPRLTACALDSRGNFLLSGAAAPVHLPGRGHGIARIPGTTEVAVLARRPGRWVLRVDVQRGRITGRSEAPADRHFYGHGAVTADGTTLYVTQNEPSSGAGIIGMYDLRDGLTPAGEWRGVGVGPHAIALDAASRTLAVAIGGIRTHPDSGRKKLNLPAMRSSVVRLDARSGARLERLELPLSHRLLSIRHLAVGHAATGEDALAFATQDQHAFPVSPFAGLRTGDGLELLDAPDWVLARAQGYGGDVRFSRNARHVCASAPRAGLAVIWDVTTRAVSGIVNLPDACAVAPGTRPDDFVLGGAGGRILRVDSRGQTIDVTTVGGLLAFDNHALGA